MTHAAVVSAHEDDEKSPNDSIYNSLLNEGEQIEKQLKTTTKW